MMLKGMEFVPRQWDDDEAYQGAQGWSYRRWAWEFLRRNADYQAECRSARRTLGADYSSEAAKFGRLDLQPYWVEYQLADDARALWLAENVEMVRNVEWSHDSLSGTLGNGQVALVFDLTQTSTAGTAALGSMQARANELLRQALSDYSRSNTDLKGKPKLYRPAAKPLLEKYLRIYDAIDIFGVPRDAVIGIFYPQYWDRAKHTIFDGVREDAHKAISKNLMKARQLVSSEYQTLVPLDVARAEEEKKKKKEEEEERKRQTNRFRKNRVTTVKRQL